LRFWIRKYVVRSKPTQQTKYERSIMLGEITRRDFIRYCATTAALLGLSQLEFTKKLSAALVASTSGKPSVIWLEGQDCAGCTVSFAGSLNPPIASIILDTISVRYHEVLMAASGYQAEKAYHETVKEGSYVLIVQGSIPTADDRFCMVGGRPFREILLESAGNAGAIIAIGACATYGGIPAAGPTGAVGVSKIIKNKPIVNLPTCPVHPDHMMGTILYYLTTEKLPALDKIGRPRMYFSQTCHDNCRRRSYFDEGMLLEDWNDPKQKNYCLIEKGCKGPDTYSDCPVRQWNDGFSFCIDCGAGCKGCAEPTFYANMSPLYAEESGMLDEIKTKTFLGDDTQIDRKSSKGV